MNFKKPEKDSLRQIIRDQVFPAVIQKKKLLELYYFFKYKNRLFAFVQYYNAPPRKYFKKYGRWRPLWISHSSISFFILTLRQITFYAT